MKRAGSFIWVIAGVLGAGGGCGPGAAPLDGSAAPAPRGEAEQSAGGRRLALLSEDAAIDLRGLRESLRRDGFRLELVAGRRVAVLRADHDRGGPSVAGIVDAVVAGGLERQRWLAHGEELCEEALRLQRAIAGEGLGASLDGGQAPAAEAEGFEAPPLWPEDLVPAGLLAGALQPVGAAAGSTALATSLYLAGSVAVALVLPESNGVAEPSTEDWTAEERDVVVQRVQSALLDLAAAEPNAQLTFVLHHESRPAPGGLAGTVDLDVEPLQRILVNKGINFPADLMTPLAARLAPPGGVPPGSWLVAWRAYADWLRSVYQTNWAFSVLVVDNANAGVGRASAFIFGPVATLYGSNSSNVFRHEFGHIFGARDEYHPDAAQSPVTLFGALGAVNANSQYNDGTGFVAGAGESVPSLMLNNVHAISTHARRQFGWLDRDGDGVLDLFDAPPRADGLVTPGPGGGWALAVSASATPYVPNETYLKLATTLDWVRAGAWRMHRLGASPLQGPWAPLVPMDGAWDEAKEDAAAAIPALPPGTYAIELRVETGEGQKSQVRLAAPLVVYPTEQAAKRTVLAGLTAPATALVGDALVLDASSSVVLGDGALEVAWDDDGDGVVDTPWSSVLTHVAPASNVPGPRAVGVVARVAGGGEPEIPVATASAVVEVSGAPPPPRAAFRVEASGFVGAGTSAVATLVPEEVDGALGRWDLDGDGSFDTELAPLAPIQVELEVPALRYDVRGQAGIPGGVAYKAIWADAARALYVDAVRGLVVDVDLSSPKEPVIRQTVEVAGLDPWSELVAVEGGWLVSASTQGLVRLVQGGNGGLTAEPFAPAVQGNVRGLAVVGEVVAAADGFGATLLDGATGQVLAVAPHRLASPAVDVAVDPTGWGVLVGGGATNQPGDLVQFQVLDGQWAEWGPPRALVVDAAGGAQPTSPTSVCLLGESHAAVAVRGLGFLIVELSAPTALTPPAIVSRTETEGTVWDVAVGPDGALYVASVTMLHVYDASSPAAPVLVSDLARRFARGLFFDATGNLHMAAHLSGYQGMERVDAPFRSKSWSVRLEVQEGGVSAQAARTIDATAYGSPPTAAFAAATAADGIAVDAVGSSDPDLESPWDGLLRYRWDWQGDGVWDTPFLAAPTASVLPAVHGAQHVKLEVRDRFWATATAEQVVCWEPVDERCGDAVDNDCDGVLDEGMELVGLPCSTMGEGCSGVGLWVCAPALGEVVCGLPQGPAGLEQCGDGLDNDCDGQIDEGFGELGVPCVAAAGDCMAVGEWVCPEGGAVALACTAEVPEPSPEVCDGLDNDCDGDIDEELAAALVPCDGPDAGGCATGTFACVNGVPECTEVPGKTLPEVCDGQDNDCNGSTDEIFALLGLECDGQDADKCRLGAYVCRPDGVSVVCVEEGVPEQVELCNGADDDCDGQTDEGFAVWGAACDGPDADACATGTWACSGDGKVAVCSEPPDGGLVELCNGLDDDCDGIVDDGLPVPGEPCDGPDGDACALGTWVCGDSGVPHCEEPGGEGQLEVCNYVDDDCNGTVDDGFEGVGQPCDGPDADACAAGWWACGPAGDVVCIEVAAVQLELCNGVDDDCDGDVDEGYPVGKPCDGPDTDYCFHGAWACAESGLMVVCGSENPANIPEVCDGVDNDCDGQTDEYFPEKYEACDGPDLDTCTGGAWSCQDGTLSCVGDDDDGCP